MWAGTCNYKCLGDVSEQWKYWITRKLIFDMHFVATFYSCLSILTSLMLFISSNADTAARCWQAPEHRVHVCEGWIHKTGQAVAFSDVSESLQRQYDTIVYCKCCEDFKTQIQNYQSALLNSVSRCCCPKSSSSNLSVQVLFSSPCLVGLHIFLPCLCANRWLLSPWHRPLSSSLLLTFSYLLLHAHRITTCWL